MDACDLGAGGDQQLGQTSPSIELSVDIKMLGLQAPPPVCQFLERGAHGSRVTKTLLDYVEDDFANPERVGMGAVA